MLPRVNNTVILPGFQAVGTRGRSLEQGDEEVKIHGEWVPVRAEVVKIETFSVHADADELVHWLKDAGKPNTAFVVHGETGAAESFASRLTYELQWNAVVPKPGQEFTL
jgi:metallo-beta-lactamase family protein